MTSTGTTNFLMTIAECMDEAFRRIRVDPATLTVDDIISARTSLNLLFIEWQNEMPVQWKTEEIIINLEANDPDYSLSTDIIDIYSCIYRDNGNDYPVWPISRSEYHDIVDKTQDSSIIDRFFFDRQKTTPVLYVYPVLTNATNRTLRAYVVKEIHDVGSGSNTPDVAKHFLPALCAGWAWKLSEKYLPDEYEKMERRAAKALDSAFERDQEHADVKFTVT